MLNIIKSDLYRLLKGKSLYIVIAVIIGLEVLSAVTISPGHIGISVAQESEMTDPAVIERITNAKSLGEFRNIMKEISGVKLDKQILGQNINMYYVFIVFVVVIITSDFSNRSVKNTLSSAISRREYFLSKFLLALGVSAVLTLFNNYVSYGLNYFINGSGMASPVLEITKISLYQMPLIFGLASLLVCIAFVVRKTSLFNTISIPLIMLVQIAMMVVFAIIRKTPEWYTDYEIQYAIANLAGDPTSAYIVKCCVLGLVYTVVFAVIGYCAFKKAEIK
ncbi:MAG: ABC transporter permease subunit [Lachnospiraceae bacterium]|nr:ABC transporter permease subunit [Lachnospiraceae bacterium]